MRDGVTHSVLWVTANAPTLDGQWKPNQAARVLGIRQSHCP
jgi:hypothetical protein